MQQGHAVIVSTSPELDPVISILKLEGLESALVPMQTARGLTIAPNMHYSLPSIYAQTL